VNFNATDQLHIKYCVDIGKKWEYNMIIIIYRFQECL